MECINVGKHTYVLLDKPENKSDGSLEITCILNDTNRELLDSLEKYVEVLTHERRLYGRIAMVGHIEAYGYLFCTFALDRITERPR